MRFTPRAWLPVLLLPAAAICVGCGSARAEHDNQGETPLVTKAPESDSDSDRAEPNAEAPVLACAPKDTPYEALWAAPLRMRQACTKTQIHDVLECVFGSTVATTSATADRCRAFLDDPINLACRTCLVPDTDEDRSRSLIADRARSSFEPNVGGCIALHDGNVSARGCGATINSANACLVSACGACNARDVDACVHTAAYDGNCVDVVDDAQCGFQYGIACGLDASTLLGTATLVGLAFCGP
jgi:hypothetical protein